MFAKKPLHRVIIQKFRRFSKHCSLHGFYYFYSGGIFFVHAIWCTIILSSLALCGFLGHMIWQKFALDPTFTLVETTHYSIENIRFPAVSICDPQVVYGPNTKNITNILHLRGYGLNEIDEFFKSLTDVKATNYTPESYIKKMHSVLEDLGQTYNSIIDQLLMPCDILVSDCHWRSEPYECRKMFRQQFTVAGYCCVFDLDYFSKQAGQDIVLAAGVEISDALDIAVNMQKTLSNGTTLEGYIQVYTLDDKNSLTLLDSPITLTPATYFDITIDVWIIDSSEDVKALELNDRKCFLDTDTEFYAGSYLNCITTLIMKKVVEHCGCLPFNYQATELNVEDFAPCTWDRLICIYQNLETIQRNIRDIIGEDVCYQRCDHVQYESEVEYVRDSNSTGKPGYNRVTVHFVDNTCMKYRREVLYTWDQMLANLGGIFGLCLGGSMISIIEFFWFTLDVINTSIRYLRNKRIATRDRVFTISKTKLSKDDGLKLPFTN